MKLHFVDDDFVRRFELLERLVKTMRGPGVSVTPQGITITRDEPMTKPPPPPPRADTAWLAIRDSANFPARVGGTDGMYYEAWIDDGVDTYLGFLNGSVAANAVAMDPNQINNVSDQLIDVVLADGTGGDGLPLHGLEISGFADGSITVAAPTGSPNGTPPSNLPLYKITPSVARWRFNQTTGWIECSYVLWPGILDDNGQYPVGDETTPEHNQNKLWVRQYQAGACKDAVDAG